MARGPLPALAGHRAWRWTGRATSSSPTISGNDTIRKVTPSWRGDHACRVGGFAQSESMPTAPGPSARFNNPRWRGGGRGWATSSSPTMAQRHHPEGHAWWGGEHAWRDQRQFAPGSADGTGAAARLNFPCGVAVDGAGNLFVADSFNDTIRKVTPSRRGDHACRVSGFLWGSADGTGDVGPLRPPPWRGGGRGGQRLRR
jgi:DNA-binding beta-propeller fold protein YncE